MAVRGSGWGAVGVCAVFAVELIVSIGAGQMLMSGTVGGSSLGRFDGCFGRMSKAVTSGLEAQYRKAYVSMMESVERDERRRAVMESFIGMRYSELCSSDEIEGRRDFAVGLGCGMGRGEEDGQETGKGPRLSAHSANGAEQTTTGTVADGECAALADLYDATGGPFWRNQTGWTDRSALLTDCCRGGINGVECGGNGTYITRLDLSTNYLGGRVPRSIGALANLTYL